MVDKSKIEAQSLVEQEKLREDPGFGTMVTSDLARLVTPDGKFNVVKLNQSFSARLNIYHRLIQLSWIKFVMVIVAFYILVNVFFALIYYAIGIENLNGISRFDQIGDFWEAFFFSSQTLTTVGYGGVLPKGYLVNTIAAFEALTGLMIFAIMTGLLYGRFSRPNPRFIYAKKAVVAPYFEMNAFMFRLVSETNNVLINVEATIVFSRNELIDGKVIRKYYNLDLERRKIKFFPMVWTVVHPITPESVLFHETHETLKAADGEFIVTIEGTSDTMSDPVHSRSSYMYNEIVWGAKYTNIVFPEGKQYKMDLSKVHNIYDAPLIPLNAKK